MSGFERALLEDKERDELSKIAESLGKKPPARAKKAEMIDLILELAGVTSLAAPEVDPDAVEAPPSISPTHADEPGPEPGTRPGDAADATEGRGRDNGAGSDRSPARARPGETTDRGRGNGAGASDGANRPGRSGAGRGTTSAGPQDGGSQRAQQGGQDQEGAQTRSSQNSGQDQPTGQGRPGDAGDQERDDDEGNRRRRRRGRNREGQPDTLEAEPIDIEGLLELREDGYGFLRLHGYLPSTDDVYVSVKQVRQFGLRKGDRVAGKSRPASRNEKNPALLQIDSVNGADPESARDRRRFEDLTPLFPDERLRLEVEGAASTMTTRIIDLIAPIGKGQRGLIVSPPKAGKTTIMKQVARSIELNHPDVTLIVLLVDERPEEVTDMRRWLIHGEVAASTFDRPSEEHIHVAELVIERAKRMVEDGKDVVIILDGITRLARAYNLAAPPSGRIMSGGIDAAALYPPKKFFGAARNAEEGGSLTILATALVETGSRMDEHIFEEFKGTGNMELRLDRHLAERRVFPAIAVDASSTRHEELLFERKQVAQVTTLRRVLGAMTDKEGSSDAAGLDLLMDRLKTFKTNAEFLTEVGKAGSGT